MSTRREMWRNKKTGSSHACSGFGPRTLCGKPIEGDGWERPYPQPRYIDESVVNCHRCRASIRSADGGTPT